MSFSSRHLRRSTTPSFVRFAKSRRGVKRVRDSWTCLNGDWDWQVTSVTNTPGRPEAWAGKIRVPFAIESALSGVERKLEPDEFLWYTRTIDCAPAPGKRILLHFEAVDFRAMVFVGHHEVTDVPHESGQQQQARLPARHARPGLVAGRPAHAAIGRGDGV